MQKQWYSEANVRVQWMGLTVASQQKWPTIVLRA